MCHSKPCLLSPAFNDCFCKTSHRGCVSVFLSEGVLNLQRSFKSRNNHGVKKSVQIKLSFEPVQDLPIFVEASVARSPAPVCYNVTIEFGMLHCRNIYSL